MPLVATKPQSANFAPKSDMPAGLHQVVINRVEDLKMVKISDFILAKNRAQRVKEGRDPNTVPTEAHKIRVYFNNAAGQQITKEYTLSMHEKATLRIDITNLLGADPGDEYDVEQLTGKQAQAMVVSKTSQKGTVYTAIGTLVGPAPGQRVAVKAAPAAPAAAGATVNVSTSPFPTIPAAVQKEDPLLITDDDIPF